VAEYLNRKVTEMDFKGNVKWTYDIDQPVGCQLLPNGNIFVVGRRQLVEVTRDKQQKFSYGTPAMYISSARKLPNGEVVLVDNNGKLTHLDTQGKTKNSFQVGRVYTLGGHIDVLPGNRILVPEYTNHKVVEYTLDGKVKWQAQVTSPTCAVRLPNGQTLVTSMMNQQIVKFDAQGKQVWSYKATGRPWCARGR
jgi:outer membrane protein assembly factor BamB